MNIRLFNVKGNDKEENKVYSEDDKTIVRIRDSQYFEVANDNITGRVMYVSLTFGIGDFGFVMYGKEKKLLNDIDILIRTLEADVEALNEITPITKEDCNIS